MGEDALIILNNSWNLQPKYVHEFPKQGSWLIKSKKMFKSYLVANKSIARRIFLQALNPMINIYLNVNNMLCYGENLISTKPNHWAYQIGTNL
jgi:hypothetical protein